MATEVTVPMIGKIVGVNVKVGDKVAEDDQIATLEAMKMEMPIGCTGGRRHKEVKITAGQEVEADTVLAVIE